MPDSTHPGEVLAAPLRRHLLQHFPADRAYPRSALRAEEMPPPVAAFLDRTLDRWVEMERDRFREDWASSGWFDADGADVQRAEQAFFDALGRSARIPAEAWEDTLGGTVDLVVRFLTVPARALTDAIFEGAADPLPADVIRARLPLFSAYPYLADVASAYFDRKQPENLDPSDLFALLDRIDRRFVSEFSREDWLTLLAPLFALSRHVPSLDGVPALLLQRFFDAKGEDDIADLLAGHDADVLNEAALRDVLAPAFPVVSTAETAGAEAEPTEPEPESVESEIDLIEPEDTETEDAEPRLEAVESEVVEPEPSEPTRPEDVPADDAPVEPSTVKFFDLDAASDEPASAPSASDNEESPNDEDTGRPLWERFAERTSDGDSVNARFGTSESDVTAEAASADDADAVPLWKRFFARTDAEPAAPEPAAPEPAAPEPAAPEPAAPEPAAPVVATDEATPTTERDEPEEPTPERSADSLDTLEQRVLGPMPPAQRKRFIKHLFNGDAGKYVTVLHGLDGVGSWTEASQIIARDVFRPSRINIYGEHAIAFTDAVEARFRA